VRRFSKNIEHVRGSRPYFRGPGPAERARQTRAHVDKVQAAVAAPASARAWHLDFSIFGPRRFESDAKDYYDNDRLFTNQLEIDWTRVVTKKRFLKLIASSDEEGYSGLEEEMKEIKESLSKNYEVFSRAFRYFCLTGNAIGEGCYSMPLNQYTAFLADCEIPLKGSKACKMSDLDTIFIATNFEEEKKGELAEENDDNSLMRFEFIEVIVRISLARFGKGVETNDASEAVDLLCNRLIQPNLCAEAVLDPNAFRHERLYNERVADTFERFETLLRAIYELERHKGKGKLMHMEEFIGVLDKGGVLTNATGVSKREAKLCFGWGQMGIMDEVSRRERVCGLTFVDFLDALGRVAELLSPPTSAELEAFFHETNPQETDTRVWEYYSKVPDAVAEQGRRKSADLCAEREDEKPTRHLAVKIDGLLELFFVNLMHAWEKPTIESLTTHLTALTKRFAKASRKRGAGK